MAAAIEAATGEPMDAALIEEQAPPGLELIVSLGSDPEYGAFLAIGAGGGDVERDPDVTHRLLPRRGRRGRGVRRAADRLGAAPGRRARAARTRPHPPRSSSSCSRWSSLASERTRASSVELNPVIVPFGAAPIAVDCVLVEADRG